MRGQVHAPATLNTGKDPVLTVQEAGWAPGPVRTGEENIAPIRIRYPDRPVCSQSLHGLSYTAHIFKAVRPQRFLLLGNDKTASRLQVMHTETSALYTAVLQWGQLSRSIVQLHKVTSLTTQTTVDMYYAGLMRI